MSDFRRSCIAYLAVYSLLMIAEWLLKSNVAPLGKMIVAAHCGVVFSALFGKSRA